MCIRDRFKEAQDMNERIEKAYAQRPKRWVFELSVAVIVTALIVGSRCV